MSIPAALASPHSGRAAAPFTWRPNLHLAPEPSPQRFEDKPSLQFTAVVEPHLSSMVATARRILASEDLAWDAVQETLLALWREKEAPPNVRAWLLKAVSHRSLHLRRSCARCRKHETRAAALREDPGARNDPAAVVERCELCAELDRAVRKLPHDQRQVFVLREVEEMSYEAIAVLLRIPVGTVRSRLNRARARLQEIVRGRGWLEGDCAGEI